MLCSGPYEGQPGAVADRLSTEPGGRNAPHELSSSLHVRCDVWHRSACTHTQSNLKCKTSHPVPFLCVSAVSLFHVTPFGSIPKSCRLQQQVTGRARSATAHNTASFIFRGTFCGCGSQGGMQLLVWHRPLIPTEASQSCTVRASSEACLLSFQRSYIGFILL